MPTMRMPSTRRIIEHALRRPAALEENAGRLLDLGLQAVVQVVMHLFGELRVIKCAQIKLTLNWFRHLRHLRS